ncbi:MAG TPA: TolC family protein [Vicinamibacterales bacterium]|nr:TolC family protein [Vicinamibacterales bacterium]
MSLLSCVLAPLRLGAQEAAIPGHLSLADAIRLAEQHNPALAVARQESALARAAVIAARQRPNPVFEAGSDGYRPGASGGFADGQELSLQVSQELEIGGRRAARGRVAGAGLAAADATLDDVVRQVRWQVGRAYFGLVGARAEAAAAAVALEEIDRVIAVNRARYEQGEVSGGELRRLEVERLRFADDALAAELATRQATSELRAMLGSRDLDQPLDPVEGLAAPPGTAGVPRASDLRALALENRSDLASLRHEQARARADQQLQLALRRPAPTLTGGYKRDFGDSGVIVGLSIPLPVFDRNAAGVARADTTARLADARLRQAEAAVAVEVQQAVDGVSISRRRLDAIEHDYLARARAALDSMAAAYRAGEADLIDFLDAQRAFRDVQRAHTRAQVDLRLSLFALQTAIGALPGDPRS